MILAVGVTVTPSGGDVNSSDLPTYSFLPRSPCCDGVEVATGVLNESERFPRNLVGVLVTVGSAPLGSDLVAVGMFSV